MSDSSNGPDGRPIYTRRESGSHGNAATIPNSKQQFVPLNLRARGYSVSNNHASPSTNGMHGTASAGTGAIYDNVVEGSSTSASVNSPTVYASRNANKRFQGGTLYGDGPAEQSSNVLEYQYAPYSDSIHNSNPGRSSRSASPLNGLSNGRYEKEDKPRRKQSWTNPLARPPQALLGRRKRSETLKQSAGRLPRVDLRKATTPQTVLIVILLVILAYTLLPAPSIGESTGSTRPSDILLASRNRESVKLPRRKWWDVDTQVDEHIATPKKRRKQTSFITPRHTYEELLELPPPRRAFTSRQPDTRSVTVFIDCTITTHNPFTANNLVATNNLLQSLHSQTLPPQAIEILVSSSNHPKSDPGLFSPTKDWVTIRSFSSDQDPLFVDLFQHIKSSFVLVLDCPLPSNGNYLVDPAGIPTSHLDTFLNVAHSEVYSGRILTTAGFPLLPSVPLESGTGPFARSADVSAGSSSATRPLVETMPLSIPAGPTLFNTTWLRLMPLQEISAPVQGDVSLATRLGIMLRQTQGIETWGLPIPNLFGGTSQESLTGLSQILDRRLLQTKLTGTTEAEVEIDQGNPARVSVVLSDDDAGDLDWEQLVCGFANEQHFGHTVQVYLPASSKSAHIGGMLGRCPDITYRRLDTTQLQDYKPDICLTSNSLQAWSSDLCTRIQLPTEEVRYVDWLPTLPLESLKNWNTPKIDLVVITNNRPLSLHRLATSLRRSHYLSDSVNLFVNMEQTSDPATAEVMQDSVWPFGQLILRHRVILGGLLPAIVESWYPADNHTYGVLLEDDVEVSPLFYSWLKYNILKYRYCPSSIREQSKRMFGISLYQPKNIELRPEGRRSFDTHQLFRDLDISANMPYLSQIPCSWGAAYFPEHWREFHQFLTLRLSESSIDLSETIVPDIRSNRWPKSWKRYIIELVYLRGYSMLYPNFEDFRSLSTNHLELGTHVKDDTAAQKRRDAFEVPLLTEEDSLLEGMPNYRLPDWLALPVIDFWGSIVTEGEIVERARTTIEELAICSTASATDEDTASRLASRPLTHDARELLCPREDENELFTGTRISLVERESLVVAREARVAEREAAVFGENSHAGLARLRDASRGHGVGSIDAPVAMMPDEGWLNRIADTLRRQQQRLEADRM